MYICIDDAMNIIICMYICNVHILYMSGCIYILYANTQLKKIVLFLRPLYIMYIVYYVQCTYSIDRHILSRLFSFTLHIYLSIYLFIFLFIYLSICLSKYLYASLSLSPLNKSSKDRTWSAVPNALLK